MNQVRHLNKNGSSLFVNIRISPSEYPGEKVYLVTTSDITQRLETEQQLIQASKMATLGEMAEHLHEAPEEARFLLRALVYPAELSAGREGTATAAGSFAVRCN